MEHQSPHGRGDLARQALATDTIVAAATPPGRGGVSIVRLSGTGVPDCLNGLLGERVASRLIAHPHHAHSAAFHDDSGEPIDQGLALLFPAPHSYTGETVLELHAHGGPVLVEALITRALQLGARRAQPGEFTQRAYLNGKLDLAQAEAVASLIDAASTAAARAALRSLEGEFSRRVQTLDEQLGALRAWVEGSIDFADEGLEWLADQSLQTRIRGIVEELEALRRASRQGRALTEGITVVIAGRPNAGKSTLLNRLAGHDAAIVTDQPGTTRDLLRERMLLDGLPVQLIDTAGLRAPENASTDRIEQEGMRRAQRAMSQADRILFIIDAVSDPGAQAYETERPTLPAAVPVTLVFNKIDLLKPEGSPAPGPAPTATPPSELIAALPTLRLSALSGEGVQALITHLRDSAGLDAAASEAGGILSARGRHLEALARVSTHVDRAQLLLLERRTPELLAEELRAAQQSLGEIVGLHSTEDLLGRIFSTFCIGK